MAAIAFGMIVPIVLLVLIAAALPRFLGRLLGRDVWALALTAVLSALALVALSGGYFLVDYTLREPRSLSLARSEPMAALRHFAGLGMMAGLIWGPVLLVSMISPGRGRTRRR